MKKENFKNLLNDLYSIYNPANIKYVDELVDRYNRLEFDAVKNIFIKYNSKSSATYNKDIGSDEYVINLLRQYDDNNRILNGISLKLDKNGKKEDVKKIQNEVEEINNRQTKEIGDLKKQIFRLEEIIKNLHTSKNTNENDIKIRIFSTYTNSEIEFPNKKYIARLGKGAKIITYDDNKKIVGLEISDITIDYVSDKDGIPIVEIFVQKA